MKIGATGWSWSNDTQVAGGRRRFIFTKNMHTNVHNWQNQQLGGQACKTASLHPTIAAEAVEGKV